MPEGEGSSGNPFHFVPFRPKVKECKCFFLLVLPENTIFKYSPLCEKITAVSGVDLGATQKLHNIVYQILQKFLEIMEVQTGTLEKRGFKNIFLKY